jgi:hypothetical protein
MLKSQITRAQYVIEKREKKREEVEKKEVEPEKCFRAPSERDRDN